MVMLDLDNIKVYHQLDTSGMLNQLREFPEQCQRAWEKVAKFTLPKEYAGINKVIILGMGGSAIAGDVIRRLALMESKVPVWVIRDYNLPSFVDENTLIIASSYSGNTEETLSAFTESFKTPAKKLAITTGGKLKKLAEEQGIPIFIIGYQAPPRVAFPHSFIPLVGISQKLGIFKGKSADLQESLKILKKQTRDLEATTPLTSNLAKQLATKLQGRIPVIYGAGLLSEVAQRWKTEFNENSKSWSFYELLPELNHNAISGYKFPTQAKERILVLFLRSSLLHPRILLRYEATAELLAKEGYACEFVEATGKNPLSQMMSLILLGDYTSFYLAILNKIDPTPVEAVDFIKNYLNKRSTT